MEVLWGQNLEEGYFYNRQQLPKQMGPILDAVGKFDEAGSCFLAEGLHDVYLMTADHCVEFLLHSDMCVGARQKLAEITLGNDYRLEVNLENRLALPKMRINRDIALFKVDTKGKILPTLKLSTRHRDHIPWGSEAVLVGHSALYLEAHECSKGPLVSKGRLIPSDPHHQLLELLHFTARSEPGSSGGPVVNSSGLVWAVGTQGDSEDMIYRRPKGVDHLNVGVYAQPVDFLRDLIYFSAPDTVKSLD